MELMENSFELISNLHHTNPDLSELNQIREQNKKLKSKVNILNIILVTTLLFGFLYYVDKKDKKHQDLGF